jgi:hypothetical protein
MIAPTPQRNPIPIPTSIKKPVGKPKKSKDARTKPRASKATATFQGVQAFTLPGVGDHVIRAGPIPNRDLSEDAHQAQNRVQQHIHKQVHERCKQLIHRETPFSLSDAETTFNRPPRSVDSFTHGPYRPTTLDDSINLSSSGLPPK